MAKIAVLTSGGVDSSVALMRLAADGTHDLTAFYIRIWLEDDLAFLGRCPWQEDLELVREVCAACRVPLEIVSLQREYLDRVVQYVVHELEAGRTPSPDVLCNRRIKFGAFFDCIDPSFERVATGHYARLGGEDGDVHLLRGVDPIKDQSYFLCLLDQRQLARAQFPIGDLDKEQVRAEARRLGLPNAGRPDSQGICFLGRVPYDEFVAHHLGERPGDIRDINGDTVLGRHRGYWFHTIGQRRGLGLSGGPWFVVGKDIRRNVLLVCHGSYLQEHRRNSLSIPEPHWIGEAPEPGRLLLRIRHGERLLEGTLSIDGGAARVTLDESDSGIAPGQFAVLYDGERCLGGGAISADAL